MNTSERNEKNVKKMQKAGKVYAENDEDKSRETLEKEAFENATREYPLARARKVAWIVCGLLWAFSVAGMLFGVNFFAMVPFLFFSLSVAVFFQLPVFWGQKKIGDFIMCIIAGISIAIVGISLLLGNL